MTAPNIISSNTITGKTSVLAITTSPTSLVSNSIASNKVMKINALYVSNVDGTNSADVDVDIYRSSTAYRISKAITVPAKATLDIISKFIYLEEGDSIRVTASANSRLEAVCSYEEIS